MSVSPEEVRRIAALARLALSDEDVQRLAVELGDILRHVEALGELPNGTAEGVEETAAEDADDAIAAAPLRADEPAPDPLSFPPDELAPEWREGLFVVPRLASHDDPLPGGGAEPES